VRLRRLAPVSALALAALVLAGCAGSDAPDASASPSGTASSDCLLDAQPGADSDGIVVGDGSVTIPEGVEFAEIQRTVLSEGDGDDLHSGDLVAVSYEIFDETGALVESSADSPAGDDGVVPMLFDPQTASIFIAALECLPAGSETVLTIPGTMFGDGGQSVVVVSHGTALSTTAEGAAQDPVEGMPEVVLGEDGRPAITIPDADAPTEVQLAVLLQGDGPVVAPGDTVIVQYEGAKWSDGSMFDSSWDRGAPASFSTAGVVDGFRQALEGKQVGSQVLVVVPPAAGYGAQEGHELQHETLVFVVDILGVQHAAQ